MLRAATGDRRPVPPPRFTLSLSRENVSATAATAAAERSRRGHGMNRTAHHERTALRVLGMGVKPIHRD